MRPLIAVALLACAIAVATVAAYAHDERTDTGKPKPPHKPSAAELAAFEVAKPIFKGHCFRCHTTAGHKSKAKALRHLNMNQYPFTGSEAADAGEEIWKTLGGNPKGKVSMPSDDPRAVQPDQLKVIKTWVDAFEKARKSS